MTTTVLIVASVLLMLMGYLLGKAIEMMIIAYQEAIDEQLEEHMTRGAQLTRVSLERKTRLRKMLNQSEIAAIQLENYEALYRTGNQGEVCRSHSL